jgi:hypothetical protein
LRYGHFGGTRALQLAAGGAAVLPLFYHLAKNVEMLMWVMNQDDEVK